MPTQTDPKITPIERMADDCHEGDILKIYFVGGGFRVGVYRGISEKKPLISNIFGEEENSALCGSYQNDWIIFIPGERKVFHVDARVKDDRVNITGYSVLERHAHSSPSCTPGILPPKDYLFREPLRSHAPQSLGSSPRPGTTPSEITTENFY